MSDQSDHTVDPTWVRSSADHPEIPVEEGEPELAPGTPVGEYVVQARLGQGAFGTVYRAMQPVIGKQVAVKVLALRYSVEPNIVSRFVAEARAVNQIRHENIIDIFSFGALEDGRRYYVMEYLEGQPLDAYLAERGRLPLDEALFILTPIAQALDAAHQTGIAHRDLKPENVFLARRGDRWFPKLLDFGIAKLMGDQVPRQHQTATGAAVGTPLYMSPEQCMGTQVDHRTDYYAFGVMAYQMLVGAVPFNAPSTVEVLVQHIQKQPPSLREAHPDIPRHAERAVLWLLAKKPEDRPADLDRALQALAGRASATLPEGARAMSEAALLERPPAGRRAALVAGAALVVGLAAAVTFRWMSSRPAAEPVPSPPAAGVAAPRPAEAPPAEPAEAPAQPEPTRVQLTLRGLPARATVRTEDGAPLGDPRAPLDMARGTAPVTLVLSAPGYRDKALVVVPDRDQTLRVELDEARRRRRPAQERKRPPRRRPGADDLLEWEE